MARAVYALSIQTQRRQLNLNLITWPFLSRWGRGGSQRGSGRDRMGVSYDCGRIMHLHYHMISLARTGKDNCFYCLKNSDNNNDDKKMKSNDISVWRLCACKLAWCRCVFVHELFIHPDVKLSLYPRVFQQLSNDCTSWFCLLLPVPSYLWIQRVLVAVYNEGQWEGLTPEGGRENFDVDKLSE